MTASNHVITGAIIVSRVSNPVLGLVLAFLAHFVLDSLPHYGDADPLSRRFKLVLLADSIIAFMLLLALVLAQPANWVLLLGGGIACASPDLMWLPYWIQQLKGKRRDWNNLHVVAKFHSKIQWGENKWGMLIEIPYFMAGLFIFERLLAS